MMCYSYQATDGTIPWNQLSLTVILSCVCSSETKQLSNSLSPFAKHCFVRSLAGNHPQGATVSISPMPG